MIKNVQFLLNEGGVFRVMVPNDNSYLQNYATNKKLSPNRFWYQPMEHMSYFNGESLKNIFHLSLFRVTKNTNTINYA